MPLTIGGWTPILRLPSPSGPVTVADLSPAAVSPPQPPQPQPQRPWMSDLGINAPPAEPRPRRLSGRYEAGADRLRVDVDGPAPLNKVTGRLTSLDIDFNAPGVIHRELRAMARVRVGGATWHLFLQKASLAARAPRLELAVDPASERAVVALLRPGVPSRSVMLTRSADSFRELEVALTTQRDIDYTRAWSFLHPTTGADHTESLVEILGRAGVDVTLRAPQEVVPPAGLSQEEAGRWDEMELHDAMVNHWDAWDQSDPPPWRMWVLAADTHAVGGQYGGVMFDGPDIGDGPQRQGAAVFAGAWMHQVGVFAENAETEAHARRQQLFTLVHEIGHAFNLAHPWGRILEVTLADEDREWLPEKQGAGLRTWMTYADREPDFWPNFQNNFDDAELRFLRHAPEHLVRMGGAVWFSDANMTSTNPVTRARSVRRMQRLITSLRLGAPGAPALTLELTPPSAGYDYLEPVYLTGVLRNVGAAPAALPGQGRLDPHAVHVAINTPSGWRWVRPYTRANHSARETLLPPSGALPLDVYIGSAPGFGLLFREPGDYEVIVLLGDTHRTLAVASASLRIHPPTDDSLRALTRSRSGRGLGRLYRFSGTRARRGLMGEGTAALRKLQALVPVDSNAWRHARLIEGNALAKSRKVFLGETLKLTPANLQVAQLAYQDFLAFDDTARATAIAEQDTLRYDQVLTQLVAVAAEADALDTIQDSFSAILDSSVAEGLDLRAAELEAVFKTYEDATKASPIDATLTPNAAAVPTTLSPDLGNHINLDWLNQRIKLDPDDG